MVGIGIRVYSNSSVFYSVVRKIDESTLDYVTLDELLVPVSLSKPEQLSYTRNTLLDIIHEYEIQRAVIRLSETVRQAKLHTIERHFLEGIIQESFASSPIEKYQAGRIAELSRLLGIKREDFKPIAQGEKAPSSFPENWKKLSTEKRESTMAAICSLNL